VARREPRAGALALAELGPAAGAARAPAPVRGPGADDAAPGVRPVRPSDMAAVARLVHREFRDRRGAAPGSLASYLESIFLRHPWADPEIPSRVYVGPDGEIGGFIGVLPARMRLGARPLRVAVAGSLVVDNPARNPLAGAKLLRAFLTGPQDLSLSESANVVSARMWDRLGHRPLAGYSLDWLCILRPIGAGVAALGEWRRPARLLAPAAALADGVAGRLGLNPFRAPAAERGQPVGADIGDGELIGHILELAKQFALSPDWDEATLRWVLAHAARKERRGPVFKRAVHARTGAPLGCYIYHGRGRGIARVLNVLARPGAMAAVVDDLLAHAQAQGCAAVRGRAVPGLAEVVMQRKALLFCRSSTVFHAKEPAIADQIRSGNALITGLAAEAWTRLIGDGFEKGGFGDF
jgi:hypothetical protein